MVRTVMSDIEEIAISKFKATCLAVLERVRRTGKPIRVTRFGKPVAEITPSAPREPAPREPAERKLGTMAGEIEIIGDIVGPIGAFNEDETLFEWDGLDLDEAAARHAHLDLEREPSQPIEKGRRTRSRKSAK